MAWREPFSNDVGLQEVLNGEIYSGKCDRFGFGADTFDHVSKLPGQKQVVYKLKCSGLFRYRFEL